MTTTDWEEEFNTKFGIFGDGLGTREEVRNYIHSLLASQREELVGRVKGLGVHYTEMRVDTGSHDDSFEDGAELMKEKVLALLVPESNETEVPVKGTPGDLISDKGFIGALGSSNSPESV